MLMPFPATPTTTAATLIDYAISQFGTDLYAIVPFSADATDQSGNANNFTAVGSPTFNSTSVVASSKNTLNKSMLLASGKYARKQNSASSGVNAALGGKGLTLIFFVKNNSNTTNYSPLFDTRTTVATAGRSGICLAFNASSGGGGSAALANLTVTADGGNSDTLDFTTASSHDNYWVDDQYHMIRVEYRKGDATAGLAATMNVYVDEVKMTGTFASAIVTADTFSDTSTAGNYLHIGAYYNSTTLTHACNVGHTLIIKRLITQAEAYAIMQAGCKTTPEGIPISPNGGFDIDASYTTGYTPLADGDVATGVLSRIGSDLLSIAAAPNNATWRRDPLGRMGVSFDNQMQTQGGDGRYGSLTTAAPNGRVTRRGVLFAGSVMASAVLAQTWQRILTYKGTSNRISFAIRGNVPVIDINNNDRYPSAVAGITGAVDASLPTVPCVPMIGTMCWGTGRDGITTQGMIGCGGRIAKGISGTMAAGSYTNTLDVVGVVGFDGSLADEDGASMVMQRLVEVGRPLLEQDYARFHWLTNAYYNPKTADEYAAAVALIDDFTHYQTLSGHVGIRDIGLTIGGTSLECATPDSGYATQNRGWQGRFSAGFTKRLAYVHTFAIGGNLAGPDKNSDGTAQSGFATNILTGTVDWTSPGLTADAQRGPITHVLWLEPWTNTMARAASAPNSGADISAYGAIQSAYETIKRWKANNPEGVVFIQLPSADITGTTKTSLIAQCVAWKADGTIADYITPTAKAALHWTYAEQAAEAIRIESLIGSVVGQSAPEPPQPGRIARIGRE